MPDEHVVLDEDALTNECVTGYLAAFSNDRVFLDLDERPNLGLVADLTTIKIDELGQSNIAANADILSDAVIGVHRLASFRLTFCRMARAIGSPPSLAFNQRPERHCKSLGPDAQAMNHPAKN
jgi:hypothetical protein